MTRATLIIGDVVFSFGSFPVLSTIYASYEFGKQLLKVSPELRLSQPPAKYFPSMKFVLSHADKTPLYVFLNKKNKKNAKACVNSLFLSFIPLNVNKQHASNVPSLYLTRVVEGFQFFICRQAREFAYDW